MYGYNHLPRYGGYGQQYQYGFDEEEDHFDHFDRPPHPRNRNEQREEQDRFQRLERLRQRADRLAAQLQREGRNFSRFIAIRPQLDQARQAYFELLHQVFTPDERIRIEDERQGWGGHQQIHDGQGDHVEAPIARRRPSPPARPPPQDRHRARRQTQQASPEAPALSAEDPRLPPPNTAQAEPITLYSPDGFATHLLHLTLHNTDARANARIADVRAAATTRRQRSAETPADIIVENALIHKVLEHVSDGPRGGIFVVSEGREDVLLALEELDVINGVQRGRGWELLGVGTGGSEGRIFVVHPPEEEGREEERRTEEEERQEQERERGGEARNGGAVAGFEEDAGDMPDWYGLRPGDEWRRRLGRGWGWYD